jgi:hypothetical protein
LSLKADRARRAERITLGEVRRVKEAADPALQRAEQAAEAEHMAREKDR